jgi:putative MATE family efflux protein
MSSLDKKMNIVALTWPIFIEMLLRNTLNMTDVFMLSGYSDLAVSAVGVITPITFFIIIISMMVSTGTGILIAQNNGANQPEKSKQVAAASIGLGVLVSVLMGLLFFTQTDNIVSFFGLDPQVHTYAYQYLIISGSLSGFVTMSVVFSTVLRSYGNTRSPMVVNLIFGVINVIGNYMVLFEPFGIPVYGVTGVACVTVTTQLLGAFSLWLLLKKRNLAPTLSEVLSAPKTTFKSILRIGVMNAGEVLFYNLAQMVIVYFVVQMGTASLTAYTYAQNIARIGFTFSVALGQASQIQTSYFVGKGWIEEITSRVKRYFVVGFFVSVAISGTFYLLHKPILSIFTQDPEVIAIATSLMLASILLEGGRVFNLIFISSLKGAGDVKFPVQIGIVSMWGLGVGLTYLFGIHFGFGVIGAWYAIAADEWARGLIMALRWRSKVWTRFKLV